ncbi:unnamed protein product [Closterium sp. NIES-54]
MFITLYFIVSRLLDSLRSVRDHFLSLDPTSLTVDLLEQHLLADETSAVAVGAARGTPRSPFFEGCSPSPLSPSFASAAAADISVAEDVGAALTSAKCRSSKGKGGRGGGGGSSGGGGGSGSGGGGSGGGGGGSGGGGGGGTGGGSGGCGGGGGGGGRSGGSGGGGTGGGRSGPRRGGPGGGQRQQRRSETQQPQQLREWLVQRGPGGAAAALGASASGTPPGTAPAEALHTFTLDSGASRCFFRDSTTLTPLTAPVPVRLADPSGGPVVARSSTVLPCLADAMVTTTTPGGQRVSICTCTRTGRHLATFTLRPGSSLYTLATKPPQVAASAQVSASGHPSLPRLRGMHSCRLVSRLPRSLPPLPPSPAPPCLPCIDGRQRAAPHSSSFPPTTAPLQTLHMDVWGPARVSGQGRERYFLLVVDDYTRPSLASRAVRPGHGGAASGGTAPGAASGGAEPGGAGSEGAEPGGAGSEGAGSGGGEPEGVEPGGVEPRGAALSGGPARASPRLSLQQLGEWLVRRAHRWSGAPGAGGAGDTRAGGFAVTTGAGGTGGAAATGPGGSHTSGCGAAGTGGVGFTVAGDPTEPGAAGAGGAGAGGAGDGGPGAGGIGAAGAGVGGTGARGTGAAGAGAVDPGAGGAGDTVWPRPYFVPLLLLSPLFLRSLTLRLTALVLPVLQRFGFQFSSPQPTPLSTSHSLSAPPSDESVEPSGPYPELVGCLMYLMTCTRPDLAYPLSLLARYVSPSRHRKVHWDAAKRVLRYLCSTSGMGLVLGGWGPVVLTGHADVFWVDDSATQRSSQGYTFSLGSGSVSWRSTRSSSVLSSSCEAEIYAGAMAAQELRWLTYLLTDLGEQPRSPPVLYVDNKAMIALCQEHRLEHKTKHIALRYFLARELQQCGQLRLAYVATRANTADVFTKALPLGDHLRFTTMLGLVPTLPHLLTA